MGRRRSVEDVDKDAYLELYLPLCSGNGDGLEVPWSTLVTLFIAKLTDRFGANLRVILKPEIDPGRDNEETFRLNQDFIETNRIQVLSDTIPDASNPVEACVLPAIFIPDNQLCVTGLCSVLRRMLKNSPFQDLLGYQGSCLSAPAEVSPWTRFCEVELPASTLGFLKPECVEENVVKLPQDLARFEEHLRQPIRMHNIRKRMATTEKNKDWLTQNGKQVSLDENGDEIDPINLFAMSQHIFSEGPDCLLSDIVIYPLIYLINRQVQSLETVQVFDDIVPLTLRWYNTMNRERGAKEVLESIFEYKPCNPGTRDKPAQLLLPSAPAQSLYKLENKRGSNARRIYTRQHEVEQVLRKLTELSHLQLFTSGNDGPEVTRLDWNHLPKDVHPMGGELPPERIGKKCHQLENMASAVIGLTRDGDTLVDFCSGGGHLAILLAYLLPKVIVYLVENKEESLRRAIERVKRLGLKNCRFFQGNMDYFKGTFNVGVSLHACGVATDLVIRSCILNLASYVACPCCYGSVQENHIISYPRSKHFKDQDISFQEYLVLGHTADQTHVTNAKHDQGEIAMDAVDSDRVNATLEAGYSKVILTKMKPKDCSPKNNLIIAKFSK